MSLKNDWVWACGDKRILYLESTEYDSNKFWWISRFGFKVWCGWGRIDTAGQIKKFAISPSTSTTEFISKKVVEKLRKGYKPVTCPSRVHGIAEITVGTFLEPGKEIQTKNTSLLPVAASEPVTQSVTHTRGRKFDFD